MKLSLAWIFDHVAADWRNLTFDEFIHQFNSTIAEVDFHFKMTFDLDALAIGKVTRIGDNVFVFVPEWNKECAVPLRKDVQIDRYYLIKKEKKNYQFARLSDFGSETEGFLPAVWVTEAHLKGEWKATCEREDYILVIDNKSLTHRPDLWGHRGFAREVATMLDVEMIPEDRFLIPRIIKNYETSTPQTEDNPIALSNDAPQMCSRLAGLCIRDVTCLPSLIHPAQRLARIDANPIDALVDATNYVMYDLGQPMHAFDADAIKEKELSVRAAKSGEKLTLLDGETISLDTSDCVIAAGRANGSKVLSLAGVMGGQQSGIKPSTTQVLLESANFNPVVVRKSAMRHKKRTEASARFEKGLDPNQNTTALMRYLFLLDAWGVPHRAAHEIVSIGVLAKERTIEMSLDFVSKKIGINVSEDVIKRIIQRLGFGLQENARNFVITVPTFRLRDVSIKEDIVEEIARFFGYNSISHHLPTRIMKPLNHHRVQRIREIKRQCAFGIGMHELSNYPLYDEEFLRTLSWQPENTAQVSNPVSENWYRLVTSLVPHLLKALKINNTMDLKTGFFEWARVWRQEGNALVEKQSLALVWYNPHGEIDFYEAKIQCNALVTAIGAPITWQEAREGDSFETWYHPFQTARLVCDDQIIGTAGKISPFFLQSVTDHGDAFIVELDGSFLESYKHPEYRMHPLSKYPSTHLDMSMFVPVTVTVSALETAIASADARIRDVYPIDYYEKSDWNAYRSVTMRYVVIDDFKTLTKEEIEEIAHQVREAVKRLGVTVR
jgi:phenylalanyl-tRNA synthetase beta chain